MPTTTHIFNYKNIPYNAGIQQIHMLENLPNAFFKLKNTTKPVSYGPCTLISCDCEYMGHKENIRIFTDRPNESQIVVFFKEGIPCMNIHLIVSMLSEGHMMTMICTYYRNPKVMYMRLQPLLDFLRWKGVPPLLNVDSNLGAYRLALGLQ